MEWQGNETNPSQKTQPEDPSYQQGFASSNPVLPPGLHKRLQLGRGAFSSSSSQSLQEIEANCIAALESDEWSERLAAVQALGRIREQTQVELIARAIQDEHENVRAAATRVLGQLQDAAPLGHILLALHDTSWKVRGAALQALGKLGRRVPVGPVANALFDEDESVRAAAAGALGEIGDLAAIEPLVEALQDRSWHVREMAVLALGRFGKDAPAKELAMLLKDEEALVRDAVESLNETQPELFAAILAARRTFILSEEYVGQMINDHTPKLALQQDSGEGMNEGRRYPRRGREQIVRKLLVYSWCIILGYLGGCAWYIAQQLGTAKASDFQTIVGIVTMAGLPLGGGAPGWVHSALAGCFLSLCAGAIWATIDSWIEQNTLRNITNKQKGQRTQIDDTSTELIYPYQKVSAKQAISRRMVITGMATVVVGGNAITWALLLQKNQPGGKQAMQEGPGKIVRVFAISGGAFTVVWSPDSTRIAHGGSDTTIKIRDATTGEVLVSYAGHTQPIFAIAWSPQGTFVASGGSDHAVHVWDARTGKVRTIYQGHTLSIVDLAWSPDGKAIVSSGQDGTVQIWNAQTGVLLKKYQGVSGDVANVAWSPDGKSIATIGLDNQLWIIDTKTYEIVYKQNTTVDMFDLYDTLGHSIGWSPDSQELAFSNRVDGVVQVIKVPEGEHVATYTAPALARAKERSPAYLSGISGATGSIMWSPDGMYIATANRNKTVEVWEAATGKPLFTCQSSSDYLFSIAWSPNGKYIAATCWDNPAIVIWEAA